MISYIANKPLRSISRADAKRGTQVRRRRSLRVHLKSQERASPQLEWVPSEWEAASVPAEVAQVFKRQAPKGARKDEGRSSDRKVRGVFPEGQERKRWQPGLHTVGTPPRE